jgi:IS5 family transposase
MGNYPVSKSAEGNEAYHPLLLMKCLLLQQWFGIDSDPELETQINDRISFKKFLGLSFNQPSPDHCTFSRFRSRFFKDTMRMINHELLSQFASKGLTINEGAREHYYEKNNHRDRATVKRKMNFSEYAHIRGSQGFCRSFLRL